MDRKWHYLSDYFYRQFRTIWILITIVLLVLCSYVAWYSTINNTHATLTETANNLTHKIDNFINNVFAEVQSLPVYEKKQLTCEIDFSPYLRHFIINHPQISGLAILDISHNLICSTLPDNNNFLLTQNTSSQAIAGPVKLPMFDYPVFSIKRKTANYYIEIIIISPMLENLLKPTEPEIRSIILYDQNKKKSILEVEYSKNDSWIYKKVMDSQLSFTAKPVYANAKLHSIDGITLTVIQNHQVMFHHLWYRQILLGLNILVISFLLYGLLKNLLRKHYSLQWSIRKALKNKQFYPVYQPLINIKTNHYAGAEVLLRWQESKGNVIMPDFFIEEAEDTGLIVPITIQIIEIAFRETRSILKADPEFHLSFNICALHFTHPTFFDKFYRLLEHYKVSPNQILLEITERDLLDETNEAYIQKMQELRKKGFSLAVDDYGTGHASISYLQYFPFNYLKIDKLFIHAIGTKAITESLNDAIIDLAKKINLIIIAEGVETEEQVNYLLKNGVQLLQGWYFSKALSIDQLKSLLRGEKNE
jgi:sensor c-di-GMP phosphodiesterase-like protein